MIDMNSILEFGKHKGKTIKQLFDEDEENYVKWLVENVKGNYSPTIIDEISLRDFENEELCREFQGL